MEMLYVLMFVFWTLIKHVIILGADLCGPAEWLEIFSVVLLLLLSKI